MQHCFWNMSKIFSAYALRAPNETRYQELLDHTASCERCRAKLQDLQDAEELERSIPKFGKTIFPGREKRQRCR